MKLLLPALLLSLPLGSLAGTSQWCHIVSNVQVNCRASPHLDSKVIRTYSPGENVYFLCYKRGDCYKDNWYSIHLYTLGSRQCKFLNTSI
jgi:hypothetical protein